MLKHDADKEIPNNDGRTAIEIAEEQAKSDKTPAREHVLEMLQVC